MQCHHAVAAVGRHERLLVVASGVVHRVVPRVAAAGRLGELLSHRLAQGQRQRVGARTALVVGVVVGVGAAGIVHRIVPRVAVAAELHRLDAAEGAVHRLHGQCQDGVIDAALVAEGELVLARRVVGAAVAVRQVAVAHTHRLGQPHRFGADAEHDGIHRQDAARRGTVAADRLTAVGQRDVLARLALAQQEPHLVLARHVPDRGHPRHQVVIEIHVEVVVLIVQHRHRVAGYRARAARDVAAERTLLARKARLEVERAVRPDVADRLAVARHLVVDAELEVATARGKRQHVDVVPPAQRRGEVDGVQTQARRVGRRRLAGLFLRQIAGHVEVEVHCVGEYVTGRYRVGAADHRQRFRRVIAVGRREVVAAALQLVDNDQLQTVFTRHIPSRGDTVVHRVEEVAV